MSHFPRISTLSLLALSAVVWTAGCKSNQNANQGQAVADTATGAQDSASDPASANLAPISNATTPAAADGSAAAPSQPAPADNGAYSDSTGNSGASGPYDPADYGEQPEATAPDPPPALPEYDQPPSPGDGYLWTPGYWGYAPTGYYWVPGVWVQAPYEGALWTPGYWGWAHGHYGFYRGYWGRHIGFYGGINYGFGYVGIGYQGGYWNGSNFYYNRAVNNVNVTIVHNVYNRTVIVNNNVRVAYNGPGGIQERPRPAELAALREPHAPPMTAQVQIRHQASLDRTNFAAVNHGRPANAVIAKPVMADRDVHPVAPPAPRNQPGLPAGRPGTPPARTEQPGRPEARPGTPPAPRNQPPARPEARPATPPARTSEPARPETRPAPAARPETRPAPASHPPASRPEERPAPKQAPDKPKPEDKRPQ